LTKPAWEGRGNFVGQERQWRAILEGANLLEGTVINQAAALRIAAAGSGRVERRVFDVLGDVHWSKEGPAFKENGEGVRIWGGSAYLWALLGKQV